MSGVTFHDLSAGAAKKLVEWQRQGWPVGNERFWFAAMVHFMEDAERERVSPSQVMAVLSGDAADD